MLEQNSIINRIPSVFCKQKHNHRSDSYNLISSETIIETLKENNWYPHTASQIRNHKSNLHNAQYAKHLITFRNPELDSINGIFPQINILNSHNGSCPFTMMVGLYRIVCSNGLIVSDSEFEKFSVRHRFLNPEVISKGIREIVDIVPEIVGKTEAMQSLKLSYIDKMNFSNNVIKKIWDSSNNPLEGIQLLTPRRNEDKEPNLWNVYNTVQENLLKGGLIGNTSTGKKRKTKEITSIDRNISINQMLWKEADSFLQAA